MEDPKDVEFTCARCGASVMLPDVGRNEIFGDCEECARKTIFQKKQVEYVTSSYFSEGKFLAKRLADHIRQKHSFITFSDTEETLIYKKGTYHPHGEAKIREEVQQALGDEATTHRVSEVENHIKRSTYANRGDINVKKELLCLQNGILNIKTGELVAHTPKCIFFNKLPVEYDPKADCPKIKQFISEIVPEHDISVIQEMVGYCLWRDYPLHKAFLFIGEGCNGKSTLMELIVRLLGKENISSIALQEIDTNRFAIAELYGKLANIYADLPDRALKHTGKFKMLTGGDIVMGERKFKGHFPFENHAKLIFSCNKVPESRDNTTAFYRRWIMINFPNKFEGDDADPNILEKITTEEEMAGFLNWAIEGLKRLLRNGHFTDSKTTEQIREEYIRKSNPIQAFVEDCTVSYSQGEISKDRLYRRFCDYCEEMGLPTKAKNVFGRELPRYIAVDSGQTRGKGTVWRGIKLKEDGIQVRWKDDS